MPTSRSDRMCPHTQSRASALASACASRSSASNTSTPRSRITSANMSCSALARATHSTSSNSSSSALDGVSLECSRPGRCTITRRSFPTSEYTPSGIAITSLSDGWIRCAVATALRISETTTMDSATARQISHCRTSRLVVFRKAWSGPKTVVSRRVRIDTPVAMTNLASANVSRLNTVRRSSLVAIEKNNAYSENVTTPMVCAISCVCACSAQLMTPSVPTPITSPTEMSQANRPRVRIGSSGWRGRRSIRPVGGLRRSPARSPGTAGW